MVLISRIVRPNIVNVRRYKARRQNPKGGEPRFVDRRVVRGYTAGCSIQYPAESGPEFHPCIDAPFRTKHAAKRAARRDWKAWRREHVIERQIERNFGRA